MVAHSFQVDCCDISAIWGGWQDEARARVRNVVDRTPALCRRLRPLGSDVEWVEDVRRGVLGERVRQRLARAERALQRQQ
jgi:hypothetical protein